MTDQTIAASVREKLECLAIAVWRGPLRQQPKPKGLDLLVVSPGGVATTSLIKHLRRYRKVNWSDDSDWLKHLPRPTPEPMPTIFVTGDADAIHASIARRGWLDSQAAKLGSPSTVLLTGDAKRRAFLRSVRRQKQAWQASAQTLFIHYEDLWDSAAKIRQFADIRAKDFETRFPRRKDRHSVAPNR